MEQSIEIVFVINAMPFAEARFMLSKELETHNIKSRFVSYSKECENYLKQNGAKVVNLIDEFDKMDFKKSLTEYFIEFEKKYNVPSMNLLILGDVNYGWLGRERAKKDLVKHFIFWEKYLTKNKIDFVVGGTERFVNEVPRAVCRRFKTQHLLWKYPPMNGYFMLTKDHYGHWNKLDEFWAKNKNKELTDEELKFVKNFIKEVTTKKERAHIMSKVPMLVIEAFKTVANRLYVNTFVEKWKNPYSNTFNIAKTRATRAVRKRILFGIYEKPEFKESYFFFPLHLAIDAQILVRAPHYVDQLSLVKNIANCLPAGYKLYVKEHPNFKGGVPIKELKEIKKIPNVKLIPAETHSHDVIQNAKCLITVNSNVGWEGILYNKPVICLGTSFYDVSGLVYKMNDFYDLPRMMKEAVNSKMDVTVRYKFINAVFKSVYKGEMVHQEGYVEKFLEKENLSNIVKGMVSELNLLMNEKK